MRRKMKLPPFQVFFRDSVTSVFLVMTTLAAVVFSGIWYLSPLSLGFAEWPSDPARRDVALTLFGVSYKFGIPTVLIAQVFAIVLGAKGYWRIALVVPAVSLGAFSLCVGTVIALLN
ncbi:hypothetical protein [Ochrobactrum sp. RH2CCR150]|uniref:hypothetical protein n=1 Tax=Ochrobactrum sp. RH2CCR150 TaxID=2587044 RepID=UPI0015F7C94B|nr:putative membrane protein [Ochrobactrum sp. RH2CCR150]